VTVAFGRIGRWFLGAGAAAVVAAVVVRFAVPGQAGFVTAMTLWIVAAVGLVQGLVWTIIQVRMFGSIGALRRTAESGRPAAATLVAVHSTSSQIGAEPIAKLDLRIGDQVVRRHVRIPFTHAAALRPGRTLPVLLDPRGTRAMVVEWDRVA
jgi:hypothetical protein